MDKQHILSEIRRTALENGGVPLGRDRFLRETGIREADWYGKYWVRWGDALGEAGFAPNRLQGAYNEDFLLQACIGLMREVGRFPVRGDFLLKRQQDSSFPNHKTFRRFGSKSRLAARILEYCQTHPGLDDIVALCAGIPPVKEVGTGEAAHGPDVTGFVYLLKSGRYYKIGKSNAVGRRARELAIQLPEKSRTVHVIRTDDPNGIEAYWHSRFAAKRRHGEWFELDSADVVAFKRRKFM